MGPWRTWCELEQDWGLILGVSRPDYVTGAAEPAADCLQGLLLLWESC